MILSPNDRRHYELFSLLQVLRQQFRSMFHPNPPSPDVRTEDNSMTSGTEANLVAEGWFSNSKSSGRVSFPSITSRHTMNDIIIRGKRKTKFQKPA